MTFIKPDSGLIFMKVGVHDGEPFEEILKRKRQEIEKAGVSFWGYGGGTCHPTHQVQPFAKLKIEEGSNIYLIMEEIHSNHQATSKVASHYSRNGIDWEPIPDGIEVRGSRYAIVLDEIQDGDLDIDLNSYTVGYGKSRGKIAADYIKGRVDKACIERMGAQASIKPIPKSLRKATHFGQIVDPYAVFVK
ncbi:MAG: hypothetical protein ABIL58_14135 [Pseudomonadota bacterium]